ncbi:MAG: DUF6293 family protein [Candidatus Bathyarchaeia archaeon]
MLRTLQIALIGGNNDAVAVGVRNFPTHKLVLVCMPKDKEDAVKLSADLTGVLKVPVDIHFLSKPGVKSMLEAVSAIIEKDRENVEDIVINVGGGDKFTTCAGTTAAFVYGLKAFDVMGDTPEMLPILKLSYNELISKAKMDILSAVDKAGGEVENLEALVRVSGYGKPSLSYHLHGAAEGKGLVELGLAEVEREVRGRSRVKLTALGKMLLLTMRKAA